MLIYYLLDTQAIIEFKAVLKFMGRPTHIMVGQFVISDQIGDDTHGRISGLPFWYVRTSRLDHDH